MEQQNKKGWLYLLPAFAFLAVFMVYPLIDVFIYSFEESFNFASQSYTGVGTFNFSYVLHDPYFLQALKNTFILVIITVPLSTSLALLISVALSSIGKLRDFFQTVFFLPYVTNTLAVGLVFMILFKKTPYSDGLVNLLLGVFGMAPVDFIDGPYWAKMFVLCFYTVWIVMPFKILILTSALASVNQTYYNAARVDGTSKWRIFTKITLPMISPSIFYLVVTGFIGAFKAYSDAVALFGVNLNSAQMNTIVGYVYDMLYGNSGGYPSYASAAAIVLFSIVLTITSQICAPWALFPAGRNVHCFWLLGHAAGAVYQHHLWNADVCVEPVPGGGAECHRPFLDCRGYYPPLGQRHPQAVVYVMPRRNRFAQAICRGG